VLAYVPALLLALFALWSGTFAGGAGAWAAIAGHAALLSTALLAADDALDPLRLGRAGRLLPAALWIAVLASALASPVARAGRVGVVLLPAFLLVPAAVARCLRDEAARRRGGRALVVLLGGVAVYALADLVARGGARAAMPLGHHNLLAAWLVTLLPLALPALRRPGPWRWAATAAGVLGVAAVIASRSLLAAVALGVEAGLALWWMGARRRPRAWAAAALLAGGVLALQAPRLAGLLGGGDLSARARLVYLEAGWRGFAARPLLGWGPGAAAWTAAEFLRPEPGVNPPSEVVADLHSLPAQALFELGATGTLLAAAVAGLFVARRLRRGAAADIDSWTAAGLIGLAGGGITRLGASALAVSALPLAAAVVAGVALAGERRERGTTARAGRALVLGYVVAATLILLPLARAHLAYDRAIAADSAERARAHLAVAARLDPRFPLYAARAAWLGEEGDRGAAREARRAAELGRGLAPLWLAAGAQGAAAGEAWAEAALRRACALDPLAGLAPFHRMMRMTLLAGAGEPEGAAASAARALLAAPQLAAADFWSGRESLFEAALRRLRRWPGVDAGWRAETVRQARAARRESAAAGGAPRPPAVLGLEMDAVPYLSPSLHAFRRRPWPAALAPVGVDAAAAAAITVPAATALATTGREALGQGCGAE
jgi:putative inorganic carbon (HCO3(-)) transporter